MRSRLLIWIFLLLPPALRAQALGGNAAYNFVRLSSTPQLTALGGVNITQPTDDIGMAFHNPALLRPEMHSRLNAVFNDFYAGTKVFHLSMGYCQQKLKTSFSGGLTYFNYGSSTETDAAGNVLGKFRPSDWVMQFSAARAYGEKWNYGAALKFISSNYGLYRSSALALDMGILFRDSSALFSASLLAKNMGAQLRQYSGAGREDLPFELQAGISKRLAHAPLCFSLTAQRLQRWDLRYNDTLFNNENNYPNAGTAKFSLGKLADHLVLATTVYAGNYVEVYAGYNFLRRRELNTGNAGNGLNGFSFGTAVLLGKLQLRYAMAYYQSNTPFYQLGLNMKLNEYFGLGKWGERIGW